MPSYILTSSVSLIYSECHSVTSSNKIIATIFYLSWSGHLSTMGILPKQVCSFLGFRISFLVSLVQGIPGYSEMSKADHSERTSSWRHSCFFSSIKFDFLQDGVQSKQTGECYLADARGVLRDGGSLLGCPSLAQSSRPAFAFCFRLQSVSKQKLFKALSDRLKGIPPPVYERERERLNSLSLPCSL